MGRAPCCSGEHAGLKKGPWTHEEDERLRSYLLLNSDTSWRLVPKKAGLLRCGKSCRLRWMNYLRPDIRRGNFTPEEESFIIQIHSAVGNKWSVIAAQLPGRTDNEIKNLWNTKLRKVLVLKGINPVTHQPLCNPVLSDYVKQWVKSIENMIIAGLMAPPNNYNFNNDNNKSNNTSLDGSLSSFISKSLQTPGNEETFGQPHLVNSNFDQSTLEAFTSGSLVEDTIEKNMNFMDSFMLDEASCFPNNLSDYLGNELGDDSSSADFIEGMDSMASVGGVSLEEGLKYWN